MLFSSTISATRTDRLVTVLAGRHARTSSRQMWYRSRSLRPRASSLVDFKRSLRRQPIMAGLPSTSSPLSAADYAAVLTPLCPCRPGEMVDTRAPNWRDISPEPDLMPAIVLAAGFPSQLGRAFSRPTRPSTAASCAIDAMRWNATHARPAAATLQCATSPPRPFAARRESLAGSLDQLGCPLSPTLARRVGPERRLVARALQV